MDLLAERMHGGNGNGNRRQTTTAVPEYGPSNAAHRSSRKRLTVSHALPYDEEDEEEDYPEERSLREPQRPYYGQGFGQEPQHDEDDDGEDEESEEEDIPRSAPLPDFLRDQPRTRPPRAVPLLRMHPEDEEEPPPPGPLGFELSRRLEQEAAEDEEQRVFEQR